MEGCFGLENLVKVQVGLLRQEAVSASLLEPMQDLPPPLGDVGDRQGERFGLAVHLGSIGNVCESSKGRKVERTWGARTVFQDLPGELGRVPLPPTVPKEGLWSPRPGRRTRGWCTRSLSMAVASWRSSSPAFNGA